MNKLYKILVVLLTLVSHISWGMLTSHKSGGSSLKKFPAVFPVLNRSFCEHKEMVKELRDNKNFIELNTAEDFLHVFGKNTLSNMGKKFWALEKNERYKAISCLSEDQKIWLRIGASSDLDFCLLSSFCNGNEKMARACCNISVDEIMQRYDNAQKMKIKYPIVIDDNSCEEQHYMVLTRDQIYALSNVTKNGTIHDFEIDEFMGGVAKLAKIDSSLICDKKGLTDSIRLYPSLRQRADVLLNAGPDTAAGKASCFFSSMSIVVPFIFVSNLSRENMNEDLAILGGLESFMLSGAILFSALRSYQKYPHYMNDLKNNVLPTQPTLTDVLKNKNS